MKKYKFIQYIKEIIMGQYTDEENAKKLNIIHITIMEIKMKIGPGGRSLSRKKSGL